MDNQEKEKVSVTLIKDITTCTSTKRVAFTHRTSKKNEFISFSGEVYFFSCFFYRIILLTFFLVYKGQTQMMWWIVAETLFHVSQIRVKSPLHWEGI